MNQQNQQLSETDPRISENENTYMVFQFIDHENGFRSQAFEGNTEKIKEMLAKRTLSSPKPVDDDYIICIAIVENGETSIPTFPLCTVKSFVEATVAQPMEQENV